VEKSSGYLYCAPSRSEQPITWNDFPKNRHQLVRVTPMDLRELAIDNLVQKAEHDK
jgi:hypothetical protein